MLDIHRDFSCSLFSLLVFFPSSLFKSNALKKLLVIKNKKIPFGRGIEREKRLKNHLSLSVACRLWNVLRSRPKKNALEIIMKRSGFYLDPIFERKKGGKIKATVFTVN